MAVTKQTYNALATWSPSQLANIFRSAFIDAGLMVDWFDSFASSGVENRILKVEYDITKTYGSTYVWFKFLVTGFAISTSATWDAVAHVPIGFASQINAYNSITDSVSFHNQPITMATNVPVTLVRYTSSTNPNISYFLVRYSTSSYVFSVDKNVTVSSVVDLDRQNYLPFNRVNASDNPSNGGRHVSFETLQANYRRSYFDSMAQSTGSLGNWTVNYYRQFEYGARSLATFTNLIAARPTYWLPIATTSANPAFASNKSPLFSGLKTSLYTDATLPDDFAVMAHYPSSAMAVQDRMVVDGVEEWEILAQNLGDGTNMPSVLFVARVV